MTSQETVAKYLSEDERNCVIDARTMWADFFHSPLEEPEGEQSWDYVLLGSRWRCGSGRTPPHSTQRTMPVLCSSSVTLSEIRRLCVQAQAALIGRDCGVRPDPSRFTVHLWDGK